MPELPDVAVSQRYLESTALHQDLEQVEVSDEGVLQGVSAQRLSSTLVGHQFDSTVRHGKHLFVQVSDREEWLELHFGMTGKLQYYRQDKERPDYTRVLFHFRNGFQLAYISPRKLGHLALVDAPAKSIEHLHLGPDALDQARSFDVFRPAIAGGHGSIKTALMSQEKLAGIGNVYSDEILYQAHIHPKSNVNALTEKDLKTLHRCMIKVLETAIERKVEVGQFPRTWLLRHREDGTPCPRCGEPVKTLKVSGRTSYLCENCQKLIA